MVGVIKMPWKWPVLVNALEAEAFCNWKSEKLGKPVRAIAHEEYFQMRSIAENNLANANLQFFGSPNPVDSDQFCGLVGQNKVHDICGNVWQHSCSVLTVMKGFKTHAVYDDFTLPTIDGCHNHILGGSFMSLGNVSNLGSRYGFRRHFYQFAGIRYVHSPTSYTGYHSDVPKIYEAVPMGKLISANYVELDKPAHLASSKTE